MKFTFIEINDNHCQPTSTRQYNKEIVTEISTWPGSPVIKVQKAEVKSQSRQE